MNETLITVADVLVLDALHLAIIFVALAAIIAVVVRLRVKHRDLLIHESQAAESRVRDELDKQFAQELARHESQWQLSSQEREGRLSQDIARLTALRESDEVRLHELDGLRKTLQALEAERTETRTRLEEERRSNQEKAGLIEEARASLLKDFQLTADKLFNEKQREFSEHSSTRLKSTLAPFAENLDNFKKQVQDLHHRQTSERSQLVGQIGELREQTSRITEEANNLARALKGDNRQQGAWGEMVLESLLDRSGLEKGREYETQSSFTDQDARRKRPDVILRLPDNRQLIIDSKVSILDYERALSAEDEAAQKVALQAHVESVRRHIKSLNSKDYQSLEGLVTLDYVMLFIPVESAYIALLRESEDILDFAERSRVVVVSPSTLVSTLRTIDMLWQQDRQNQNALKIAESAGKLYDQFVLFTDSISSLGSLLGRSQNELDMIQKRFGTGNGNLLKRFEDLRKLGAKARKSLPAAKPDSAIEDHAQSTAMNGEACSISEEEGEQLLKETDSNKGKKQCRTSAAKPDKNSSNVVSIETRD